MAELIDKAHATRRVKLPSDLTSYAIAPGSSSSNGEQTASPLNLSRTPSNNNKSRVSRALFERPISPPLPSELVVREEVLIDRYFKYCFRKQFQNKALIGSTVPAFDGIRELINTNNALKHSVCALAALTFPYAEPSANEVLTHLTLALALLREMLANQPCDEGVLLAIIELVEVERSSANNNEWKVHLDAALTVFSSLPILNMEFATLSALQAFFVRNLTFADILAATSLRRTPTLYLRNIHNLNVGIGVHRLFGCSDRTLSVINQGAELDVWKAERQSLGELSIGELYKRGARILMQLWDGSGTVEGLGPIVAEIFRCATVIYINVIISGAYSGVEEMKKAIPYLVDSIQLIMPHPDALRLVCWPLVIGGSLAIQTSHRQSLKEACVRMDGIGDFTQALAILEKAWAMRDLSPSTETHWRDIMGGFGVELLFT